MKCNACQETISPKFAHSIKLNICPFCGGEIMHAELQRILSALQLLMTEAEPFITDVEDWFASNYSLRKGGKQKEEGQNHASGGIFDENNVDEDTMRRQTELAKSAISFQQRAGIKQPGMKSIVEKIQNGAADPSEFRGIDPDYGEIDMSNEEILPPLTKNDTREMMSALSQENSKNENNDPVKNYYELEKIKKLQRSTPTGGGRFSRGG